MIVLYEENEINFTSLGLGVLSDPISCIVTEGLNDNFELEMVYPVIGKDYSKLKIGRFISSKTNPYDENAQPFRITSITKPINGKVTINAVHISYDTNGVIVGPIKGNNLRDTVEKIQNGSIIPHNFKLYTDISMSKTFATSNYYNLRALLMGNDSSLVNVYDLEVSFDKFKIYLNKIRGKYRGTQIRYAKNMKDLTHVISYEKLYNGVYPFYHQEVTETTTNTTQDGFKQVYIVGTKPFQDGWLSYTDGGEPYHPVDEAPVQIGTEGDYYGKVYCWNTNLQRFQEKLYNETVTVIEGVIQPEWIYIDWTSAFPEIICRAKKEGYFKLMTETEWTFHKVDDIVFQGNLKNIAESLILYYSEVIPESTDSEITTTESTTHVELKDKIILVDTEAAKSMLYNRILSLDLTSEFEDVPTEDDLELKAKEYIEKNKIGQYKYETRVSFVDLSRTTEGVSYEGFDKVLLGDIVKVIYEDMNVDVELRVISTKYDALKDSYESVDLGEKPDKISSSSVQNGDGISALTNDIGYADITTVNKLIAKTITADYIKAVNATLTKAQIEELETARIRCSGIIEASQFELDSLVAKLLVADNAVIKETLEAGTVKVNGDITVSKGSINIRDDEKGTVFNVDREGNLKANSVAITGGSLNINDGIFEVTPEGTLYATGAVIRGEIHAFSGEIAQFTISEDSIYNGIATFDEESSSNGVYIGIDGIRLGNKFSVDDDGNISIKSGSIEIQNVTGASFIVTSDGKLTATSATINGEINAKKGSIGADTYRFTIGGNDDLGRAYIYSGMTSIDDTSHDGIYIGTDGIALGKGRFKVSKDGTITISGYATESYAENYANTAAGNAQEAAKTWVGEQGYQNASQVTTITENTIKTTTVIAQNLRVQKLQVKDENDNILLDAGVTSATSVIIGGFNVSKNSLYNNIKSIDDTSHSDGIYIGTDGIALGRGGFKVTSTGALTASSVSITGGTMGWYGTGASFSISTEGRITATGANITGDVTITSGSISIKDSQSVENFKVTDQGIMTAHGATIYGSVFIDSGSIEIKNTTSGSSFKVDENGKVSIISGSSTGTESVININNGVFSVNESGQLVASNADINGTIEADSGTIGGFDIAEGTLKSDHMTIDPDGNIFGSGLVLSSNIQANALSLKDSIIAKDITLSGVKLSAGEGSNTKTVSFSAHVSIDRSSPRKLNVFVDATSTVPEATSISVSLKIFTNLGTYNDNVVVTIQANNSRSNTGTWTAPSIDDAIVMFVERGLTPQSKTYSGTAFLKCSNYSLVGINSEDNQAFKIGWVSVTNNISTSGGYKSETAISGITNIVAAVITAKINSDSDYPNYKKYENSAIRWSGNVIYAYSAYIEDYIIMYIGY